MRFIELERSDGQAFLFDIDSGWEIYDNGKLPALWTNYKEGRNLDCKYNFQTVKNIVMGGE
jgi:hypothetical protein